MVGSGGSICRQLVFPANSQLHRAGHGSFLVEPDWFCRVASLCIRDVQLSTDRPLRLIIISTRCNVDLKPEESCPRNDFAYSAA